MRNFVCLVEVLLTIIFRPVDNTLDANKKYQLMRRLSGGGKFQNILARYIENKLSIDYQLAISKDANIGENFKIVDPQEIRIGRTTEIGNNCVVYPGFSTISAIKGDEFRRGQRRHPKIGNNCVLGSNATVIGAITVGDDVTILNCAIVSKNIPPHCIVFGTNIIREKSKI